MAKEKVKESATATAMEALAGAAAQGKGKDAKGEKSIEHIRELLVGKLARAIRKQLDDIRADMERGDKETRGTASEIDRRHTQQIHETHEGLAKQIAETSDRFSHKVDTVNAALLSRHSELDTRLTNTASALDNTEKRLRTELNARVEDLAHHVKEVHAKLDVDFKAKTNELAGQLGGQREEMNEQLVDVRRTIDVRGRQMKDELNAFVLGTADGLRKSVDGLAAAFESDKTDMRAYNEKRFAELIGAVKDLEKRVTNDIEEQVSDLSSRLLKRMETTESVFNARSAEIESQVESLRGQLEEKSRQVQSFVEETEKELRTTVQQSAERSLSFAREAKSELERKLVYREDIGNKLIELGMRLSRDLNSGDIVKAIEEGSGGEEYEGLEDLDVGDERVASVDDILNLMHAHDEDEAAPPPPKGADLAARAVLKGV